MFTKYKNIQQYLGNESPEFLKMYLPKRQTQFLKVSISLKKTWGRGLDFVKYGYKTEDVTYSFSNA